MWGELGEGRDRETGISFFCCLSCKTALHIQVLQNETSARRTAETRLSAADSDLAERDRQVASLQHSLQAAHRDDAHRRSALEERVRAAEEALRRKDRELAEGRATVRGLETDLEGLRAQVADREREVEEGRRMAAQAADERRQVGAMPCPSVSWGACSIGWNKIVGG